MSKFERKYTWKHVLTIALVFVIAACVNLIPHQQTHTAPCKGTVNVSQKVTETTKGWPFTYSTKLAPKSVCVVYKKGQNVASLIPETTQSLNVWALLLNEVLIAAIIGVGLLGINLIKARKK